MCFKYPVTKRCCSPSPPKESRNPDLRENSHTQEMISQGKPAGEEEFFNYVEHWLKWSLKKNLSEQQELNWRRTRKAQTPLITELHHTRTGQQLDKQQIWSQTRWSAPNMSILQGFFFQQSFSCALKTRDSGSFQEEPSSTGSWWRHSLQII